MSTRRMPLTEEEIRETLEATGDAKAILSPGQFATLIGSCPKTVYFWIAQGRLDGAYRKRGKHILIWRDRALKAIFNGKEWANG